MSTIQFKTNINCSGCVAKATPVLNQVAGAHNWQVDTANPEKILTVTAAAAPKAIIEALQTVGFKATVRE
ncbi:MAG TPA: cation transporter [Chitinophaga sp.]